MRHLRLLISLNGESLMTKGQKLINKLIRATRQDEISGSLRLEEMDEAREKFQQSKDELIAYIKELESIVHELNKS